MQDVIVMGAGVVGAATAYALTLAGARVEVLEAGQVGGGTSAATFAVDISPVKTPRALFDLSMASKREHEALEKALPGVPWRHDAAWMEWERSERDRQRVRDRLQRLQAWGYPAEWVSPERARELEPALTLPAEADEIALYRDGTWYDAPLLARALLDSAQLGGAAVHAHDPVTAIAKARGRITEVITAAGRRVAADVVVNCAGPQAGELVGLAGAQLPLRRVPGLVAVTTPASTGLRTIVHATDLNMRPDRGGRVMLHSWLLDAQLGPGPEWTGRVALAERLLLRAKALLPGLAHAKVQDARVGIRPVPLDGLPLVGFVAEVENLYAVVAHSAAHLAPILGRLAASELSGTHENTLDPFRPTRFRPGDDGPEALLDENTRTMLASMDATTGPESTHAH
jgi:glycine/D-amino acid oxidase-like deaminating enzyme